MYKAQYSVSNENGDNRFPCQSYAFVVQDSQGWITFSGKEVQVIKWNRTRCEWELVKFKL